MNELVIMGRKMILHAFMLKNSILGHENKKDNIDKIKRILKIDNISNKKLEIIQNNEIFSIYNHIEYQLKSDLHYIKNFTDEEMQNKNGQHYTIFMLITKYSQMNKSVIDNLLVDDDIYDYSLQFRNLFISGYLEIKEDFYPRSDNEYNNKLNSFLIRQKEDKDKKLRKIFDSNI